MPRCRRGLPHRAQDHGAPAADRRERRVLAAPALSADPVDVEISIVDHENREMVRACLLSLPAACADLTWRTTVIDNVSNDGSLEMLASEFPDVRVVSNTARLGFGANHNQVIRRLVDDASARYVLVLNDDTELGTGSVTRMVATLDADPDLGAVVPSVLDGLGRRAATRLAWPSPRSWLRADRFDRTELPDPVHGWLQGSCLLLRVAALRQVGGFDERFFLFYEDVDLSQRLVRGGWRLGECPEATVLHHGHGTVFKADIVDATFRHGLRSRYLYFDKHLGRPTAALLSATGRSLMLARSATAWAHWARTRDPVAKARARRLLDLARLNPRRPLPAERAARRAGGAPR